MHAMNIPPLLFIINVFFLYFLFLFNYADNDSIFHKRTNADNEN